MDAKTGEPQKKKDWFKVDAFLFAELGKLNEALRSSRPKQEASNSAPVQEQPHHDDPVYAAATTDAAPTGEVEQEPPF